MLLYNLLLWLFSPLIYVLLLHRLAKGKEDRDHWGQRWGQLPDEVTSDVRRPRFWVHAVSVGEVMAAVPVLRELRQRFPDAFILLSTTTPGGREVALKQVPPADVVVYYPLDFGFAIKRALRAARPDAVLLMEWEIWPNFLTQARRMGAVVAVLNGRISDKGLRRGRKSGGLLRPGLNAVNRFAMQSEEDSRRAALVGADPARVVTLGNTKFDESSTPLTPEERTALRAELGIPEGAPVWVCGSTRPGEEEIIADAVAILEQAPNLQHPWYLIVAPRHLDRVDEVEAALRAGGLTPVRRSRGETGSVLILDTFGELARLYAIADVAFVGGSLLPFGGQSVFQPLAQGVPAVFGPYMNNQRDIAALSIAGGLGQEVDGQESLAHAIYNRITASPEEKRETAQRARALIERNQGVARRCVDEVETLLRNAGRL